jgi:hypothetical protein
MFLNIKSVNLRHLITGLLFLLFLPPSIIKFKLKMNIDDIKVVQTKMGEPEVFNVLQSIPGVTSERVDSLGLNVRGRQADQNLIFMNETIVLSNSHALGFLTAFIDNVLPNSTCIMELFRVILEKGVLLL